MRVWARVCQARIQDTYQTEENLLDMSVFSSPAIQTPHAQGFTPSQASTSAPEQTQHLTASRQHQGPQPAWTRLHPHLTPSLLSSHLSHLFIQHTHTHTHPSPSSPVQISIPAIEKPSPLIPLLNSLNQTPSIGFYNLPDVSFIGVTAVPDCVCDCCENVVKHFPGRAERVCILLTTELPALSEAQGAELAFSVCGIK